MPLWAHLGAGEELVGVQLFHLKQQFFQLSVARVIGGRRLVKLLQQLERLVDPLLGGGWSLRQDEGVQTCSVTVTRPVYLHAALTLRVKAAIVEEMSGLHRLTLFWRRRSA